MASKVLLTPQYWSPRLRHASAIATQICIALHIFLKPAALLFDPCHNNLMRREDVLFPQFYRVTCFPRQKGPLETTQFNVFILQEKNWVRLLTSEPKVVLCIQGSWKREKKTPTPDPKSLVIKGYVRLSLVPVNMAQGKIIKLTI